MPLRISRSAVDKGITLTGVALVIVQLLRLAYSPIQVAVVIAGVLLIYIGIWRIFSHMLPDRRVYRPLRGEVDEFIDLVRRLNAQKARGDHPAAFETASAVRQAAEQIIATAGLREGQKEDDIIAVRANN